MADGRQQVSEAVAKKKEEAQRQKKVSERMVTEFLSPFKCDFCGRPRCFRPRGKSLYELN